MVESVPPALRRGIGYNCSRVEPSLFGSSEVFTNNGALSVNLIQFDGSSPPFLRITRFAIVCEATGLAKDTINSISVLIQYDVRQSGGVIFPGQIAQLTLDCVPGATPSEDSIFPPTPPGTLGTDLDTTQSHGGIKLRTGTIDQFSLPTDTICGACKTAVGSSYVYDDTNCERKSSSYKHFNTSYTETINATILLIIARIRIVQI